MLLNKSTGGRTNAGAWRSTTSTCTALAAAGAAGAAGGGGAGADENCGTRNTPAVATPATAPAPAPAPGGGAVAAGADAENNASMKAPLPVIMLCLERVGNAKGGGAARPAHGSLTLKRLHNKRSGAQSTTVRSGGRSEKPRVVSEQNGGGCNQLKTSHTRCRRLSRCRVCRRGFLVLGCKLFLGH